MIDTRPPAVLRLGGWHGDRCATLLLERETDKAYLVRLTNGLNVYDIWLPKRTQEGDTLTTLDRATMTLTVPAWLYEDRERALPGGVLAEFNPGMIASGDLFSDARFEAQENE